MATRSLGRRRAVVGASLLIALGSFGSCGSKDSLIVVTASPAYDSYATNLHTLVVTAGTTQKSFHSATDLATTAIEVGLYVPSSLTGSVNVTAEAVVSGGQCGLGYKGSTTVTIPSAGSTVTADIIMDDATTCPPTSGTGGTVGTGGVGGTLGTGGKGGTGGTGGSSGGSNGGGPDFSRCTEIDHGTSGSCAGCTLSTAADVSVYGVAFSPDGATVVTGGTDGRVKIWTNANGTLTAQGTTPLAGTGLGCVAFSPDGSLLAIGRIGGVDIVSTSTWTVLRTLQTATSQEAYAVGFSPDSTKVFTLTAPSSGGVTGVLFAHAVGNTQSLTVQSVTTPPWGMAVAPNIVAGTVPVAVTDTNGNASLYSWSATTSSFGTPVVLKVTSDGSTAEGAAFSPQSIVFASGGDDGLLSLWNYPAAGGSLPDGQIDIHAQTQDLSDYVGAVAFSPTYGYLAVGGSFDGTLTGYTLTDGSQVGVEYDTSYDILSLAYSPTSNVIVAGEFDCGCVVVCPQ
ncbi:MAG TPA: hypothetical protein VI456_11320 [Polyangia bacterium]